MRVLVTGGAGFIGANLCRRLLATPGITHVVVLDDLSTGSAANLAGLPVRVVVGSVLDEAMRLYPSFWMIDRCALEDDEADGIRIPAGVTVVPYIYGVHRNPEVWEAPERFDPTRFEDEARKGRHPFAHIPFGGGPRKCIGSNMAIVQMLLVLATLLRRYDFEPTGGGMVDMAPMMILHPKGSIEMRVRRRAR